MINIENILMTLRNNGVSDDKLVEVRRAYNLAYEIHKDQYRQSGDPYIIHPLNVANNLLKMEIYDSDTISAALLHDTIEDATIDFTRDDIAEMINPDVAELVDGVTKMRRMNFSTEIEQVDANTRKIINGLAKDVRIILIKLADRLHNMQTLEFKKPEKQKENAVETMELFVPLALTIGAYRIKNELEDLALQYIEPAKFQEISEIKESLKKREFDYLFEKGQVVKDNLDRRGIVNDMILRSQTISTIYKKWKKGYKLENIYDLFYLKFLVDNIENCYRSICVVHEKYPPINGRFKDYIFNPKPNYYRSLHTTVSDANGKLIKFKVRTFPMEKVDGFGLSAFWNIEGGKTKEETQAELREKCQFVQKLMELDESFSDNAEFIREIKSELLTEHVYVYTYSGDIIELPYGSTALDFACQVCPNLLDEMTGALINEMEVPWNHVLKDNDRVKILTDGKIDHSDWDRYVCTPTAKHRIKKMNGQ